jgi:hypothetical protein
VELLLCTLVKRRGGQDVGCTLRDSKMCCKRNVFKLVGGGLVKVILGDFKRED